MDLILWRHAEAEERRPDLPDERRRLTPKGEKQARKVAKWLRKRLPKNTRILVSPTERTQMTAHALGMPYELEDDIRPDADVAAVLAAVGWPTAAETIVVVGHQPTLGQVAARLMAGEEAEWSIKKSAAWWLSLAIGHDDSATILRAVVSPDDA